MAERWVSIGVGNELISFDWGAEHQLGSTAFWIGQARRAESRLGVSFTLGRTLAEEVVACLLGGYGVPAQVGLAAFETLRNELDLDAPPSARAVVGVLEQPLQIVGRPRPVRYRFPRQRGERIAAALSRLAKETPPSDPLQLRDWLRGCDGVGPKTASWIVRNHTGNDQVAIIDIHIQRAGVAAGFFDPKWRVANHYERFEVAFLEVARLGQVRASVLDACMWYELQRLGSLAQVFYYGAAV